MLGFLKRLFLHTADGWIAAKKCRDLVGPQVLIRFPDRKKTIWIAVDRETYDSYDLNCPPEAPVRISYRQIFFRGRRKILSIAPRGT